VLLRQVCSTAPFLPGFRRWDAECDATPRQPHRRTASACCRLLRLSVPCCCDRFAAQHLSCPTFAAGMPNAMLRRVSLIAAPHLPDVVCFVVPCRAAATGLQHSTFLARLSPLGCRRRCYAALASSPHRICLTSSGSSFRAVLLRHVCSTAPFLPGFRRWCRAAATGLQHGTFLARLSPLVPCCCDRFATQHLSCPAFAAGILNAMLRRVSLIAAPHLPDVVWFVVPCRAAAMGSQHSTFLAGSRR